VLFVCHNPMLARFLSDQVSRDSNIRVEAANRLLVALARRHGVLPQGYRASMSSDDPWFIEKLLPGLLDVRTKVDEQDRHDVLVVDEAQDLFSLDYLSMFGAFIHGGIDNGRWRIFHDRFNQGAIRGLENGHEVEEILSSVALVLDLDWNCRNTGAIVNETRLATGADLGPAREVEGPPVEIVAADDQTAMGRQLASWIGRLLAAGVKPQSISVLSPLPFEQAAAARMPSDKARNVIRLGADAPVAFPASGTTFCTIAEFKGLENSHIGIVDIDVVDSPSELSALYVAMTRARASLWMAATPAGKTWLDEQKIRWWPRVAGGMNDVRS
jgi:hypothetical protein